MTSVLRLARVYYRINVRLWSALRRVDPVVQFLIAVGMFLATSSAMMLSGQTAAATVYAVVMAGPIGYLGAAAGAAGRRM